jgi:hypothetical protein
VNVQVDVGAPATPVTVIDRSAEALLVRPRLNAKAVENKNIRTDGITENKRSIIIPLPAVALPEDNSIT